MNALARYVQLTAIAGVILLLPGVGCVIEFPGGDPGGGGGTDDQVTVRLVNASGSTLDPELYVADQAVSVDQLFVDARKFTTYGVGTIGLLGEFGSDTVHLTCEQARVLGTRGGRFGDDLNQPDGTGQQRVLTQEVNYFCGDVITLTYSRTGATFTTTVSVSR